MRLLLCLILALSPYFVFSQAVIAGSVFDDAGRPLEGATVQLSSDSIPSPSFYQTDKSGQFTFERLSFQYYKLTISYMGYQTLTIDSIHLRAARSEFNLGDLQLKPATTSKLNEIIIYVEKPVLQSKDGNITFHASESPMSQGSSVSDLLETLPLVSKDPEGRVQLKGREPRILIDDKPVQLNMQQMQDLLESLPGSSIEKIEVMTNPPPQYAHEPGGVINIVTKKGAVGVSGRINVFTGSRGEQGGFLNFNYRKSGFVFNINGGLVGNRFTGNGNSVRENMYKDSVNHLNTANHFINRNVRPNVRVNIDYDVSKKQAINLVFQYNTNDFNNQNITTFTNLNRWDEIYRLSTRDINSNGLNLNHNLTLNYTLRTNTPGEVLKVQTNVTFSDHRNNRLFYQQFLTPAFEFTGIDSTQNQHNQNAGKGLNFQLSYDRPLHKKTFISLGTVFHANSSEVLTDATYKRRTDGAVMPLPLLSNHFDFIQQISNVRASVRHKVTDGLHITTGLSAEETRIRFDLYNTGKDTANQYWSYLPFAIINKTWNETYNLRLTYRRSIRRPGINELNPTIDFSDPYNTRFGNPLLEASTSHNFDFVLGKSRTGLFTNMGAGYHIVQDIFSQIRTLQPDGKTEITWQNISGRKEYQLNSWNGYTVNKKLRFNLNAGYTYNQYSDYDKQHRNFRDGSNVSSSFNTNYTLKEIFSGNINVSWNRFANPQGTVRSTMRINAGVQAKLLNKKMIVALNAIDPFVQQESRFITYGKNFMLDNRSFTNSRNYRLSVSYHISKVHNKTNVLKKAQSMPK